MGQVFRQPLIAPVRSCTNNRVINPPNLLPSLIGRGPGQFALYEWPKSSRFRPPTPESFAPTLLTLLQTTAAVSGTATAGITETDIVAGGKTIIIDLANDTWVSAGANFDAQRQNIINGLTSDKSTIQEPTGWNAVVKILQGVASVVRTSNTRVTITLDAQVTYNITAQETITVTVPNTAMLVTATNVIGTPTFTVSAIGVSLSNKLRGKLHGGIKLGGRL